MRCVLIALCLTSLVAFVGCGLSDNPESSSKATDPIKIFVTQLAQEFFDDTTAASQRYLGKPLEITGAISQLEKLKTWQMEKEPASNEDIETIVFLCPVSHKTTGENDTYTIRCLMVPPISPDKRKALGLGIGKSVIIRGQLLGVDLNNPQASIQRCTLVTPGGP